MIQQAEPSERGWALSFFVKKNMGFNFVRQITWALTRLGLFTKPQFCFAERDRGGERERETVANGGKNGLLLLDF